MSPGIHLLHKPVGPTSFSLVQDCIASAEPRPGRRLLRICHGGALDPFASGLMLILVEPATQLFDFLHDIPKTYQATVRWGVETDNCDPNGKTVSTGDSSNVSVNQLEEALKSFIGWQDQIPPATSNKRIAGERAYVKAHRGETVEMPPSRVYLHAARWISHDLPHSSRIELTARGGYYIRSLARDLGRLIGCGAHLSQLNRTSIGPWLDPGPEQTIGIPAREALPWLGSRILSDPEAAELRKGLTIPTGDLRAADWAIPDGFPPPRPLLRGLNADRLSFLLEHRDDRLHPIISLRGFYA